MDRWVRARRLVKMQRVVQVDAAEDREDVGLQQRNQQLERRDRHEDDQRHHAEHAQRHHEARQHLQQHVADRHVREQAHRQADRPAEIGHQLLPRSQQLW